MAAILSCVHFSTLKPFQCTGPCIGFSVAHHALALGSCSITIFLIPEATDRMETTIVYRADPSKEHVQIAGNFTHWHAVDLTWSATAGQYVFRVIPDTPSGKLEFKFIVDGVWLCDQNYASELDISGNLNNVIIYDHSKDQSASIERTSIMNSAVQRDIAAEPITPDPTPRRASVDNTSSTVASKAPEPTSAALLAASEPLTTATTAPTASKSDTAEPESIGRPSVPEVTASPDRGGVPSPAPVARPAAVNSAEPESSEAITVPKDVTPGGNKNKFAFFARLLQLISEFFRRWFYGGN